MIALQNFSLDHVIETVLNFFVQTIFRSYEIHQPGILLMLILLLLLLIMFQHGSETPPVGPGGEGRAEADSALHVGHKLTAVTFHIPVIYSISSICTSMDYILKVENCNPMQM